MKTWAILLALATTGHAAITVSPQATETNPPPGSIVVPPPRNTPTGEKPSATATNAPTLPTVPQLVVSLADGSKLIGSTTLKALTLRSEALGKLTVPLERIRQVKFSKDHESTTVTLHNGDRIQAGLGDTKLALMTLFGPVTVPLDKATEIQISADGTGGAAVEWDLLPVPVDHGWGGAMGEPPTFDGDDLVLRGWQARTKQTYRQPQVIECELSLDQLRANDGCVWIGLGPANLARDRLLREAFLTVTFGYSGRDGSGGHVTLDCAQRRGERLAGEEFAVAPRTSYKLRIELSNDTLRVMVNNQTYEAGNVTLPAEDCRLYVRGWQPGNTWRVRNVSVR